MSNDDSHLDAMGYVVCGGGGGGGARSVGGASGGNGGAGGPGGYSLIVDGTVHASRLRPGVIINHDWVEPRMLHPLKYPIAPTLCRFCGRDHGKNKGRYSCDGCGAPL